MLKNKNFTKDTGGERTERLILFSANIGEVLIARESKNHHLDVAMIIPVL